MSAQNDHADMITNLMIRRLAEKRPLGLVLQERRRQDTLWGTQNHDMFTWLAILSEEVGEFSQAVLETRFGGPKGGEDRILAEAVQVAAVALAIVECLQRGEYK